MRNIFMAEKKKIFKAGRRKKICNIKLISFYVDFIESLLNFYVENISQMFQLQVQVVQSGKFPIF